jgi:HupE / UreJ protein
MNDFIFYFKVGWTHIISTAASDHLLFIAALSIIHSFSGWKKVLLLVTAFTIGHAITLYLSALDIVRFDTLWVEFAIPCTIVLTAAMNLAFSNRLKEKTQLQYPVALVFGFVHGMGYANYIRMMLSKDQQLVWGLFSFNVGLEIGQIFVVLTILLIGWLLTSNKLVSHRMLVILVSIVIIGFSLQLAILRFP